MKIKKLLIRNFRLFKADNNFEINNINVPDGKNEGSGLTVFVGENGCGKSTILDAFALPMLAYKAEAFTINDFFDPTQKSSISIFSEVDFEVNGTMPNSTFKSQGFLFEAGQRSRGNKAYLSSVIVSDQRYIKANGLEKPKDGSPDLRVNVNNPFSGQRFDENDVLFLDKGRTYQIRSGTFNATRFDRLMEDFNYQYLKKNTPVENINDKLVFIDEGITNDFLKNALDKFKEFSGQEIKLELVKNFQPFNTGFFANTTACHLQIPLDKIGSGYEMIFSILYSFYLSEQSKKQLIILLDEAELHLHPALQKKFVKVLLQFAKTAQIILTTHSPLFVKQLLENDKVLVNIFKKDSQLEIVPIEEKLLPFPSSNEINYLAYNLPTEEYHNELYEELKHLKGLTLNYKDFDTNYFVMAKGESKTSPWKGNPNEVSTHTFLRNQIHHPKENGRAEIEKLAFSIDRMRKYLKEELV